jgi:phenylpropionate dioxygenase-like ring-hydroxylating dioxygenase large terminal subunit
MYHDLTSQQFGRTLTVVYATPIRKGECRLFARFPFKFSSNLPGLFIKLTPRWFSHIGNNGVLEDDQIFLHLQERELEKSGAKPYAQSCYLPTQADRYVLAFRKWVSDFQADPFPGKPLGPAWTKQALLDRYSSHTQHCSSCRNALKRIQQIRTSLLIASALSWSLVPLEIVLSSSFLIAAAAGLTGVPLLAVGLWFWLGTLERKFYQGQEVAPRNLPEKRRRKTAKWV